MSRWFSARSNGQWSVLFWLLVLALGLVILGAGIGEACVQIARHLFGSGADYITFRKWGKPVQALIVLVIAGALIGAALWQLRRSTLGLTFAIMEKPAGSQVFIGSRPPSGLPDTVLFSGHMGMLIALNALRDSVGRVTAVTPPGSDYRSIARLLRPSHPEARIISATAENAELGALLSDGTTIHGSVNLETTLTAPIEKLFLASGSGHEESSSWPIGSGLPEILDSAGLIVFGPGSFFTSIVPAFLVPDLRARLIAAAAKSVYICNVMTEPGRTDGWTVSDFIHNFVKHAGFAPHYAIVNRSYPGSHILSRYEVTGSYPVMVTPEEHIDSSKVVVGRQFPGSTTLDIGGSTVIEADVIEVINETRLMFDPHGNTASEQTVSVIRHDSEKLTRVLRSLIALTRAHAPGT